MEHTAGNGRWHRIPGMALIRGGRPLAGTFSLLVFLFFPAIMLIHAQECVDSIGSFLFTLLLLLLGRVDLIRLMQTEIYNWWIATAVLIGVPLLIWELHGRSRHRESDEGNGSDTQWTIAWRAFRKQRAGLASLFIILALYLISVISPYLAPYSPSAQQDLPVTQFRPPLSDLRVLHLREPRVPEMDVLADTGSGFLQRVAGMLTRMNHRLTDAGVSRLLFVDSFRQVGDTVVAVQKLKEIRLPVAALDGGNADEWSSSRMYILGTDRFGRGILTRLLYGSRVSLMLGLVAVLLAITVGTAVGLISGYFGGRIDSALMRFVDMLLSFPSLFLLLIIISLFEKVAVPRILLIVAVLGLTSWMGVSRLVRGQVLAVKEEDYILAARALGLGARRIILRHILPNILTPIIINATLRLGGIILVEAALSFLNLGVQPPTPSWGNIIYEGRDFLSSAWWISTFPGLAIVFAVICFNLLGDSLRDALDPRMKG